MIFILRIIAVCMFATIMSKVFPTFWGGYFTSMFVGLVTSVRVVKKEANE